MSIKSALIGFLLFVGSVFLAYILQIGWGGLFYSPKNLSNDDEIHLKNLKADVLRPTRHPSHVHTEKIKGPLRISISNIDKNTSLTNGLHQLKLTIESESDLVIHIKWSIPNEIRLISGELEEDSTLLSGEKKEFLVDFQPVQDLSKNHQIHVYVSGSNGPLRFTEIAQYNTLFEEQLSKSSQLDLPENPESQSLEKKGDGESSVTVFE